MHVLALVAQDIRASIYKHDLHMDLHGNSDFLICH